MFDLTHLLKQTSGKGKDTNVTRQDEQITDRTLPNRPDYIEPPLIGFTSPTGNAINDSRNPTSNDRAPTNAKNTFISNTEWN